MPVCSPDLNFFHIKAASRARFSGCQPKYTMKHITFYLDFISPFAWLAFDRLPQILHGTPISVSYQPILFAGLLKHYGQLGPAEIPGKREWTYRQVVWLARQHGVALEMPAKHPFNPLALMRLALACAPAGQAARTSLLRSHRFGTAALS